MRRAGSTTLSPERLAEILHNNVSYEAIAAVTDDRHEGDIPDGAYLQSVGVTAINVDEYGDFVVSWEALLHVPDSA